MPKTLLGLDSEGLNQHEMGLYDRFAAEYPSVEATKVLDITDIVPGEAAQAVIKYAQDSTGTIVQFQDRYEPNKDMGMRVHFYLHEGLARDLEGYFVTDTWGFEPSRLIQVIVDNLPHQER